MTMMRCSHTHTGIFDQRLALQWVQDNVAQFGMSLLHIQLAVLMSEQVETLHVSPSLERALVPSRSPCTSSRTRATLPHPTTRSLSSELRSCSLAHPSPLAPQSEVRRRLTPSPRPRTATVPVMPSPVYELFPTTSFSQLRVSPTLLSLLG